MSSGDKINYVNIALMVLAAVAAYALPFEVFLFAYAVMGPLHYLTEISWLHERGYFTKHRRDYLFLGALGVLILVVTFAIDKIVHLSLTEKQGTATTAIFVAFVAALAFAFLKSGIQRAFAISACVLVGWLLRHHQTQQLLFAIFLPTLFHVFVFTGAFVLFGALKSKSRSGLLSFVAFLLVPVGLWLTADGNTGRVLPKYVLDTYMPFAALNQKTIEALHLGTAKTLNDVFYSTYGNLVMRFIAYAYAYHYLNWFSKTSVIGWHREMSKGRLATVLILWVVSVGLYAYNYTVGFRALYCLSFLHVFLEFPLNHVTFVGIVRELSKVSPLRQAATPNP